MDKADDGGAEAGDERLVVLMLAGILVLDIDVDIGGRLDFEDMPETQVLQGGIDAGDTYVVGELPQEHSGQQGHGMGELVDHLEVVLLDIDGIYGAGCLTLAAVDAAVLHNKGLAIGDADGFGRANLHAPGTSDAVAFVNFQGVVKHIT